MRPLLSDECYLRFLAPLPRAAVAEPIPDAAGEQSSAAISDGYWLNDLSGKGIAAFNSNPGAYKVFRNVKEYGAKGK